MEKKECTLANIQHRPVQCEDTWANSIWASSAAALGWHMQAKIPCCSVGLLCVKEKKKKIHTHTPHWKWLYVFSMPKLACTVPLDAKLSHLGIALNVCKLWKCLLKSEQVVSDTRPNVPSYIDPEWDFHAVTLFQEHKEVLHPCIIRQWDKSMKLSSLKSNEFEAIPKTILNTYIQ